MVTSILTALTFGYFTTAAMIYKPEGFKATSAKVVVVVHGCLQSAESMAFGAGFNLLAEQNNLLVIYPQVPGGATRSVLELVFAGYQRADSGELNM